MPQWKDHIYVVGLDPSLGTGGDPSAIQVYCAKCDARYEEIMEVRVIDEPNENDESE